MIEKAKVSGQFWGLVLGTLGRQGNPRIFDRLQALLLQRSIPHMLVGSTTGASYRWDALLLTTLHLLVVAVSRLEGVSREE